METSVLSIFSNPTVQVIWGTALPVIVGVFIKMFMSYRNAIGFFGVGGTGAWVAEVTPIGSEYCQVLHVGFTFIKLQCVDGIKFIHTISFKKRPWKFLDPMGIIEAKRLFLKRAESVRNLSLSDEEHVTQQQLQEMITQLTSIAKGNTEEITVS
jgi:hypothetical protein